MNRRNLISSRDPRWISSNLVYVAMHTFTGTLVKHTHGLMASRLAVNWSGQMLTSYQVAFYVFIPALVYANMGTTLTLHGLVTLRKRLWSGD
ncbi:hypothetical protein FRX31_005549 [Thalictrum thalictroides]|uniref:Uncharacterized protein n=1 Tax=Thalictrum thalictroides TaxID=46969 RepID=A0A7J6X590_THATH|nr:hypothetical protein FRX31_005549 [Thalictrum thalictroides]